MTVKREEIKKRNTVNYKVSIIMPAYNCANTIADAIESILEQSYKNIQLVIVNDGSNDNTQQVVEKYKAKDDRIVCVPTANHGVGEARNIGLNMADGDFVMFTDSDDRLNKDAIKKFVGYQKKYKADIIKCTFTSDVDNIIAKQKNKWVDRPYFFAKDDFVTSVYPMIFTSLQMNNIWTLFVKREIAQSAKFDTQMTAGEDLVYVIDLITNANSMLLVPDALYQYNQTTTGSITRKNNIKKIVRKYKDNKLISKTILQHLKVWGIDTPMYRNLAKNRAKSAVFWKIDRLLYDRKQNAIRAEQQEIFDTVQYRKSVVPAWIEPLLLQAMHSKSEDGTYPNWKQIQRISKYYELRYLKMPVYSKVKRLLDIVISLLMIIVLLPLMLLTAIIILLKDGRPVIYKQTRLSIYGRPFQLYKFRSMPNGIEKDTGAVWSNASDNRATPFGKFIRRYKIDELPQLFNILKGDMSFVGCRPERPEFYDKFKDEDIQFFDERILVIPGLTGLAQIKGGTRFTPEQKLAYDLLYIRNRCLKMDIQLFLGTITSILKGKSS